MHRIGNVQGLTISATSALAPKDGRKAFERGLEFESKGKLDEAKAEFEKAVMVYPRYAAAWFELGKLDEQAKNVDAARGRYQHSLEADSKYVQPLERLSMLAFQDQDWQNVQDLSAKLLSLDPLNYPLIYYLNGVANFQLKRFDPAEKSIREAIRLDPANKNARSHYVLGLLLAQKHDYAASLESLRAFLTASPQAADAGAIREQVAGIEAAAKAAEQQKR
jgi:tetratricopeptide (TPR) repeat protein